MENFRQAVSILPQRLRELALALEPEKMGYVEEIRLRAGRVPALTCPKGEVSMKSADPVTTQEIELLVQNASRWSLHTVLDQLRQGYLTTRGGHRLGLCGTAVMEQGQVRTIREITSVNLRIAREKKGCASKLALHIKEGDAVGNTLIIAPPGAGKTTLLRDLIRQLSDCRLRVAVADERGELSAMWQGMAQLDLGASTDVLAGCPKAVAIEQLLRGMNPQVIAVDEITAAEDVRAIEQAVGCGVSLLATAHARQAEDLKRRALYRQLLTEGIFHHLVLIDRQGGRRNVRVIPAEELGC